MSERQKDIGLDCRKKCESVVSSCLIDGSDSFDQCRNRRNQCLSECPYTD